MKKIYFKCRVVKMFAALRHFNPISSVIIDRSLSFMGSPFKVDGNFEGMSANNVAVSLNDMLCPEWNTNVSPGQLQQRYKPTIRSAVPSGMATLQHTLFAPMHK